MNLSTLFMLWTTIALALPPETADAVALGDCDTVVEQIVHPEDDDERLALGWCLRRSHPKRAADVLRPTTSGVLGDYGRWTRAEALAATGRAEEALRALADLELPGPTGLRVRIARARVLLSLGRSLDARPDLRALLDTKVQDEARYLLSKGAEDRGDAGPAVATYRRAWATSTRGPWSLASAEALGRLGAAVPDYSSPDGRALIEDRIGALRRAHMHAEALDLLLTLRESTGDIEPSWDLGRAYFRARRYADAVATWQEVFGSPEQSAGPPEAMFDYALATSRTGNYRDAAVIYERLVAQHPTAAKADEASFKLGYLPYDKGSCPPAIERFDEHLARYPSSKFGDSARWFKARCQWTSGDRDGAVATWTQLAQGTALAAGAKYWLARAAGVAGEADQERAKLAALVDSHPASGHAWFAAQALGREFPAKEAVSRPAWPPQLRTRRDVVRAEALLAAGLRDWARAELAPVEGVARTMGRQAALAAAHAFIASGAYTTGKRLARPYCGPASAGGDPVAQQACFPRPEANIVSRAAARHGLHPLLPYGIMIAESATTPDVTSIAGARGLMQIMPAEGGRLHQAALGDSGHYDPDRLYRAPYNALLGTTELGLKRSSLEGVLIPSEIPAVIASYNAGEDAVRRWLAAWEGPAPYDEFAEAIGYTETRQYVRRVLGHLMEYRWVYGDP